MKRFLTWSIMLALIVLGATACFVTASERTVPAIAVSIQDKFGGGTQYLPAVDDYVSGHGSTTQSGKTRYSVDLSFEVTSAANGHFIVMGHYIIDRNGVLTEVNKTLPVYDKKPDQTKWSKLDNELSAFAYMSDSTLRY